MVHGQIDSALQDQAGSRRQLRDQIQGQIARLQTRVDNLIDLVADGGLAGSKAREKITEIERERAALETRLGTIEDDLSIGAEYLKGWLELLRDPYELYRTASNDMRRDLNQAIFTRIFVIDQDRAESELQEHVRLLLEAQAEWAASFGLGIDTGSNENDAEASSSGESTEGHWRKPVDLALGSSKQSLVPLEVCGFSKSWTPVSRHRGQSGVEVLMSHVMVDTSSASVSAGEQSRSVDPRRHRSRSLRAGSGPHPRRLEVAGP